MMPPINEILSENGDLPSDMDKQPRDGPNFSGHIGDLRTKMEKQKSNDKVIAAILDFD